MFKSLTCRKRVTSFYKCHSDVGKRSYLKFFSFFGTISIDYHLTKVVKEAQVGFSLRNAHMFF